MDMRKLEELKEKLMRELDVTSGKSQMTFADIQMIDTLTHSIKNICKILEESGHSGVTGEQRAAIRIEDIPEIIVGRDTM